MYPSPPPDLSAVPSVDSWPPSDQAQTVRLSEAAGGRWTAAQGERPTGTQGHEGLKTGRTESEEPATTSNLSITIIRFSEFTPQGFISSAHFIFSF